MLTSSPTPTEDRAALRRRLTLTAMCIAQGMALLDVTIVNTALPSIQRGLTLTPGQLPQWWQRSDSDLLPTRNPERRHSISQPPGVPSDQRQLDLHRRFDQLDRLAGRNLTAAPGPGVQGQRPAESSVDIA
jgi:hypothetical protein